MEFIYLCLSWISRIAIPVLGYFIEAVSQNRLFLVSNIFNKNFCATLLNNSQSIIWWLFWIYIASKILVWLLEKRIKKENIGNDLIKIYENVCKEIHVVFIQNKNMKKFKISLLKAFDRNTETPYLKVIARHQLKQPVFRKSKVIFLSKEGCAGLAYSLPATVQKNISCFSKSKSKKYYHASKLNFNLSERKAKKLNEKACHFLCIPIKCYKSDSLWGVLSIDSSKYKKDVSSYMVNQIKQKLMEFQECFV